MPDASMPAPIQAYAILSALLFCMGALGVLIRRNIIIVFMSIELMLNAANLNLIAAARHSGTVQGQAFALLVMGFAAAEVAVGLALVVALYRRRDTVSVDQIDLLKG